VPDRKKMRGEPSEDFRSDFAISCGEILLTLACRRAVRGADALLQEPLSMPPAVAGPRLMFG